MNRTFDVAIAGGGIVGAACAAECARAGMSVALVERELVGSGATAAGMGHIVVMDDSAAQFALTRFSQRLWHEMSAEFPSEVEFEPTGTIWVAADDDEMAEVRRKHEYYAARGVRTEILDQHSLREAEPNLRLGLAGGLLAPEDAVVYPPCAALYFWKRARDAGATLISGTVAKLEAGNLQLAEGTVIAAGVTVNAAGAWASELTAGVKIRKRKGHLLITDRYPEFVRHQLVELGYLKSAHSVTSDSVAFNVQPRRTGQLLIGSSRQYDNESKNIDHDILQRMLERACAFMPGIGPLSSIRAWTGFRAATPDKLPLIGPWPESPGLFLATGHEGLGITTSLATARLLVDQIAGRPSEIAIQPYLPSRSFTESHV